MRLLSIRAVLVFLICCAFTLNAAPNVQLGTRLPEAELKARQQKLKVLMQQSSLSSQEKEQLKDLMDQAAEIAEMNDRCGTISITEMLDERCQSFYESALANFETAYFKVTGEIQMNAIRFSKAMNDKRAMIESCYEGLPLTSFYPSAWLEVDGRSVSEPLEKGFELAYDLTLQPTKYDYAAMVKEIMRDWHEVCNDFIHSNTDVNKLAPLFVSKFENSKESASDDDGALYFELDGKRLKVLSRSGIQGVYKINDEEIFEYLIMPDEPIFIIDLESGEIYNLLKSGSWSGTKRYYRDDKGLYGMLRWENAARSRVKAIKKEQDYERRQEEKARKAEEDARLKEQKAYEARLREERGEGLKLYPQLLYTIGVGLPISFADAELDEFADETDLKDSIYQGMTYGALMLYMEANSAFSIGVGAGYAYSWSYLDLEDESVHLLSFSSPAFVAEVASHSNGWTIGARGVLFENSDYPAVSMGLFFDLADLVGMEFAWLHTEDFADCFYVGFSVRLIPHQRYLKDSK